LGNNEEKGEGKCSSNIKNWEQQQLQEQVQGSFGSGCGFAEDAKIPGLLTFKVAG
jgi:hypothetical protein